MYFHEIYYFKEHTLALKWSKSRRRMSSKWPLRLNRSTISAGRSVYNFGSWFIILLLLDEGLDFDFTFFAR